MFTPLFLVILPLFPGMPVMFRSWNSVFVFPAVALDVRSSRWSFCPFPRSIPPPPETWFPNPLLPLPTLLGSRLFISVIISFWYTLVAFRLLEYYCCFDFWIFTWWVKCLFFLEPTFLTPMLVDAPNGWLPFGPIPNTPFAPIRIYWALLLIGCPPFPWFAEF